MERREYKTIIQAPREKVWDVLWKDNTYREWTSVFSEGSRAESDWQEGSKIYFLNAEDQGMVSVIQKKVPNEYMSFKHLGVVKNGIEDMTSEEVAIWAGSTEDYTLKKRGDKTELIVEMDIAESFLDFFSTTWPKAMDKIKSLSEA